VSSAMPQPGRTLAAEFFNPFTSIVRCGSLQAQMVRTGLGVDMRTVLAVGLVGFFLPTTLAGLLESAYAQTAKANSKPQATGQIICNSSGCKPVKPGCRIEAHRNVGQIEVCGNNRNLLTPTH
jgi:hypothetical protein